MMTRWIYEGMLDDPFEEFFVAEQEYDEDDSWRTKYHLRTAMIPGFISGDVAHRVRSRV
jgi:gamma-tubulin complex component 3